MGDETAGMPECIEVGLPFVDRRIFRVFVESGIEPSAHGECSAGSHVVSCRDRDEDRRVIVRQVRFDHCAMQRLEAGGRAFGQALVDLTSTVAAYNMVSRFLVVLHIGH